MPKKSSSVLRDDCLTVMDETGTLSSQNEKKYGVSQELALRWYHNMILTRNYDERSMMLQRQGRIGFYVPSFGQEAIHTGTASPLEKQDWIFPSYREPGVFLYRGASLVDMFCNLYGNSGDSCHGRQMPVHYSFADLKLFSVSSPIATQVIQAVGASYASKIKKLNEVAITYFGDGATSENDFHTGMTFAGSFQTPTVFICTNNQYAISVPLFKQTACDALVKKAAGYGIEGVAVDGNDVFAVYHAVKNAIDKARSGKGPTFIECLTLRMGPHSSSDDPTRYRDEALYQAWKKRDPIDRLKNYLISKKWWSEEKEKEAQEAIKNTLLESIEKAEKMPEPSIESLFEDVYQHKTEQLVKQQQSLIEERELRGKFVNTSEAFPL